MVNPAAKAKMPTSAHGNPETCCVRQRGFTLLELMVVITIVALATAGVSLSLRDSAASQLEREAQRLTALLTTAHAQARTVGVPLWWRATPQGFELAGRNHLWLTEGTRAHLNAPGLSPGASDAPSANEMALGPEPMMAPQRLTLSLQGRAVTLATDGLRPFSLVGQP